MRTVPAVSVMQGWKVGALEFKQTHLHFKLSEDIELKFSEEEIVKVCNAITGLLQSTME